MAEISRRTWLAAGCGAYVSGLTSLAPAMTRKVFSFQDQEKIVAKEKWARIEKIAENCWAVVSTPFDARDFTTVCNGGIIAGKERVMVVESFMNAKGANWVAVLAKKLTGKWPTDVVVTHFHGDHSSGASAFFANGHKPKLWVTQPTVDGISKNLKATNARLPEAKRTAYPDTKLLNIQRAKEVDLGDRTVRIVPRQGHTKSDVTIEISNPNIVFCGDLFFNKMVPNYSDALPVTLGKQVEQLQKKKDTLFVPGHGPVADQRDLQVYREFLESMETSARKFFDAEKTAEEAAREYKLPKEFEDWFIFSPAVVPRAMNAWYREFKK